MLAVLNALVPVFLIILLGAALKRSTRFDDAAWTGFENICYFVLFPILLIKTLASDDLAVAAGAAGIWRPTNRMPPIHHRSFELIRGRSVFPVLFSTGV